MQIESVQKKCVHFAIWFKQKELVSAFRPGAIRVERMKLWQKFSYKAPDLISSLVGTRGLIWKRREDKFFSMIILF